MNEKLRIGDYNTLAVVKNVDFGTYLDGGSGLEILLPARYVDRPLEPGKKIRVFVYRDNEGRLIATTEHPYARVGEFAFLQVTDVNRTGAFLDWGLMKQLLLPYSEQTVRLSKGMVIPVYVYLDDASQRIVASAKLDRFLGNRPPHYRPGNRVKALVYKHTELGYKAVVDNLFHGFFYDSDLYSPLEIGVTMDAYVKNVRPDGKVDLVVNGAGDGRIEALADRILHRLSEEPGGWIPLDDSSSPEAISHAFACSKKDFKKAVGSLYRRRLVEMADGGIKKV